MREKKTHRDVIRWMAMCSKVLQEIQERKHIMSLDIETILSFLNDAGDRTYEENRKYFNKIKSVFNTYEDGYTDEFN